MALTDEEKRKLADKAISAQSIFDQYSVITLSDVEDAVRLGYDRACEDCASKHLEGGTEAYTEPEWAQRKDCAEEARELKHGGDDADG